MCVGTPKAKQEENVVRHARRSESKVAVDEKKRRTEKDFLRSKGSKVICLYLLNRLLSDCDYRGVVESDCWATSF